MSIEQEVVQHVALALLGSFIGYSVIKLAAMARRHYAYKAVCEFRAWLVLAGMKVNDYDDRERWVNGPPDHGEWDVRHMHGQLCISVDYYCRDLWVSAHMVDLRTTSAFDVEPFKPHLLTTVFMPAREVARAREYIVDCISKYDEYIEGKAP